MMFVSSCLNDKSKIIGPALPFPYLRHEEKGV